MLHAEPKKRLCKRWGILPDFRLEQARNGNVSFAEVTTVSRSSSKASVSAASGYVWFLILAAMAAINLTAFWALLGSDYYPEHYRVTLEAAGILEITWMLACCAGTVVLLAWLRHHPDRCRRLVLRGLVATGVSCVVLAKQFVGAPLQCLDPILFSTACGWTVVLWLWTRVTPLRERTASLRFGRFRYELNATRLLAAGVGAAAIGLSVYFLAQQIHYFNTLRLGYADCGEYARIMFNTLHNPRELFLRVNPETPLFSDHFQPGFLPFVPFWLLWPDLNITSLLQVLAVMGCTWPVYRIGVELFRDKLSALLLAAIWLAYPSVSQFIYNDSYGFRGGSLCLPMYFLALAFWVRERRGWALLFAVWAILLKEEAAIPIGMFGLYLVFFERRHRLGIAIAAIAFVYFLVMTSVVIPMFNHHIYPAQDHFAHLGATKGEILLSPWTKPRVFWGNLLAPSTLYFAALLLGPLLFVPLKKPSVLLVGSLVFLFDCLHPTLKSICYQYQAALLPVVFWAFAVALQPIDPARRRALLQGAIVAAVLFSLFFGNVFWSKSTLAALPESPDRLQLVERMRRDIAPAGSLFATERVAAHFITQKYLYVDPPVPPDIDYVLLDTRDTWKVNGIRWLRRFRNIQRQVESIPALHLARAEDGVVLYSREEKSIDARNLVEKESLPPEAVRQPVDLGQGVTIAGYDTEVVPSTSPGQPDRVHITIFCSVEAPVQTDLAVRCVLHFSVASLYVKSFASDFQLLGQSIWPVQRWVPGKFYADDFVIDVPVGSAASGYSMKFEALTVVP
jgi:uncharacterized membrane protein